MKEELEIRKGGWVWLHLPEKEYKAWRCIGRLKDRTLHVYRMSQKHVMKSVEGFGFCEMAIRELDYDRLVVWITETRFLETTKSFILNNGTTYTAEGRNLELQIFLPISKFGSEKAKKWKIELDKKFNPFFDEYNKKMGWVK